MKDFFMFETELPAGSGFELFGLCHLIWLSSIVIFSWISGRWYAGKREWERKKIRQVMGVVFPIISIYRDTVLMVTGHFDQNFLPLHLCGMALWIAALYIWTENRFLGVVYVQLCIPGAAGALLFPDWSGYPLFNYMHIHDFISHGLIVAFGYWLLRADELVPGWKDLWMTFVFGIVGCFLIYPVNVWLGTNYWFLNRPSAGSPLVWIREAAGNTWYLAAYFLFCFIIVVIWQGIIKIFHRTWSRKRGKITGM